ncbi:thiol peroxidase [Sulfurospirillum sp. T05]|uniref:Thiol peroxidase n=1 Tax=Sulfurospirillum tamanense TaxID=2813362 RepID=A0ABS2WU21_9BACT|nr:thiol peroxidase [Sulfurospirillum tamanensis]MBN2965140.1 thiol peroxidase [Sulfurospirillum tamanensis]
MVFQDKADYTAFKGERLRLGRAFQELGNPAPIVTLLDPHLEPKTVGMEGNTIHILTAPSFDTPTCAKEAHEFSRRLAQQEGIEGIFVSMDLPFAAASFCNRSEVENLTFVSDFKAKAFAKAYGVLIENGPLEGLCARAIFIVSKDGRIVYKHIVPEITDEPDYEEALQKAIAAANQGASCCGFCQ